MAKDAKIYLILPCDDAGPASNELFTPAQMHYRLGQDGNLYKAVTKFPPRKGLMCIDASPFQAGDIFAAEQIIHECLANNHSGIMLDTVSAQHCRLPMPLVQKIMPAIHKHNLNIYISHNNSNAGAVTVKTSAPLDGSTEALIRQIKTEYSRHGFALYLAARSSIFSLPGRDSGRRLAANEVSKIIQQHSAPMHYSTELEAMYSLFRNQGREHMLIWDNAETMAQRVHTAFAAGAAAVFIAWPEIKHMWPQLQPLLWSVRQGSYSPKFKQNTNHR